MARTKTCVITKVISAMSHRVCVLLCLSHRVHVSLHLCAIISRSSRVNMRLYLSCRASTSLRVEESSHRHVTEQFVSLLKVISKMNVVPRRYIVSQGLMWCHTEIVYHKD